MAIFRFFTMSAVRHLGFVVCVFGHAPAKWYLVFITLQNLVGIDTVLPMQVFIFSEFGLKTPIHAAKWRFLKFDPQIRSGIIATAKTHLLTLTTCISLGLIGPSVLHSSPF